MENPAQQPSQPSQPSRAAAQRVARILSWPAKNTATGPETWRIVGSYSCDDPWAITLDITGPGGKCSKWHVSREVLREGLIYENGLGDFTVGPEDAENVRLTFMPGRAESQTVLVQRRELAWLLQLSADLIPIDEEAQFYDLDRLCDQLLGREL